MVQRWTTGREIPGSNLLSAIFACVFFPKARKLTPVVAPPDPGEKGYTLGQESISATDQPSIQKMTDQKPG